MNKKGRVNYNVLVALCKRYNLFEELRISFKQVLLILEEIITVYKLLSFEDKWHLLPSI